MSNKQNHIKKRLQFLEAKIDDRMKTKRTLFKTNDIKNQLKEVIINMF